MEFYWSSPTGYFWTVGGAQQRFHSNVSLIPESLTKCLDADQLIFCQGGIFAAGKKVVGSITEEMNRLEFLKAKRGMKETAIFLKVQVFGLFFFF